MVALKTAPAASGVGEAMVTVLENDPAAVGTRESATVTTPPAGIFPRLHVMAPPPNEQGAWLGTGERKFTPGGKVSVKVTDAAGAGPWLLAGALMGKG